MICRYAKKHLLIFMALAGCVNVQDRGMVITQNGNHIINARKIHREDIRLGTWRYGYPWRTFWRQTKGMDTVIRDFIDAYNEKHGTNFNAIVEYHIPDYGRPRNNPFRIPRQTSGYIYGRISGMLLEVE